MTDVAPIGPKQALGGSRVIRGVALGLFLAGAASGCAYFFAQWLQANSHGLVRPAVEHAVTTDRTKPTDLPKKTGCWVVSSDSERLAAQWALPCQEPIASMPGMPHNLAGLTHRIVLPAFEVGTPDLSHQKVSADLSPDTATVGSGGLLYLPAAPDGSGYYVAAWAHKDEGLVVGLYGAYPSSVATPHGRVYIDSEFKPKSVSRARPALEEENVEEESSESPNAEPDLASSKVPAALELDL